MAMKMVMTTKALIHDKSWQTIHVVIKYNDNDFDNDNLQRALQRNAEMSQPITPYLPGEKLPDRWKMTEPTEKLSNQPITSYLGEKMLAHRTKHEMPASHQCHLDYDRNTFQPTSHYTSGWGARYTILCPKMFQPYLTAIILISLYLYTWTVMSMKMSRWTNRTPSGRFRSIACNSQSDQNCFQSHGNCEKKKTKKFSKWYKVSISKFNSMMGFLRA